MSRTFRLVTGSLFLASILFGSCRPNQVSGPSYHADWILTGGQVVTVDKAFSFHEALAIKEGRIIAVGTDGDARAWAGPSTRIVDLHGKTVIPGIQDSHIHFVPLGRDVSSQAELTYARNADEILKAMSDLKTRLRPAPGQWLIGNRWDQYKYPKMVTRWQLDQIAPENPVFLKRVYRGTVVNSLVFKQMGIDETRPDTWPAWWSKDPSDFTFEDKILREERTVTVNGKPRTMLVPTGVFIGAISSRLVKVSPMKNNFEDDVQSVRLGVDELLRLGITALVDPSSNMGYNMRVYQEAYNRGYLKMRIAGVYEGTFNTHPPDEIRKHLAGIQVNNLGDNFLRWRGTKFYGDGGAGTRSAWVSEPFDHSMELEKAPNLGNPVMEDSAVREAQYRMALEYGWDLHTHSCGDRAMRQTVDLYKKLMDEIRQKRPGADLRWSVIHAYLPMEEKTSVLADMAKYGIVASSNPVFNWQEGAGFSNNLGPERMARTQPFRSYVKAGVLLTSGSDYGVTSHNPWMGFYALLTRRDQTSGKVFGPDETLGIEDALRSYTINGAKMTYDEKQRGSLEVGKLADLVVLDIPDIRLLEKDPELCHKMADKIVMTMVEGQPRFQKH
jgi:predicted amidohydrolase YtcJ